LPRCKQVRPNRRDGEAECGHDDEEDTSVAMEERKGRNGRWSMLLAGDDGVREDNKERRKSGTFVVVKRREKLDKREKIK